MELFILGGGTPYPGADKLLFDCGPAATQRLAKSGLSPTAVTGLFFTHQQFDHNVDYPCFVLSRWDQGAGQVPDLRVWGPWPTKEVTERLFGESGAFRFDVEAPINHEASLTVCQLRGDELPRERPRLVVEVLESGARVKRPWAIEAARADHVQPYLESLAYRVETGEGSVVIAGDTEPCETLLSLARGADTLVITCWDEQSKIEAAGLTAVVGTTMAGQIAADAQVKRLVLTHLGRSIGDEPGRRRAEEQVA